MSGKDEFDLSNLFDEKAIAEFDSKTGANAGGDEDSKRRLAALIYEDPADVEESKRLFRESFNEAYGNDPEAMAEVSAMAQAIDMVRLREAAHAVNMQSLIASIMDPVNGDKVLDELEASLPMIQKLAKQIGAINECLADPEMAEEIRPHLEEFLRRHGLR